MPAFIPVQEKALTGHKEMSTKSFPMKYKVVGMLRNLLKLWSQI